MVQAHASVTISWNTHAAGTRAVATPRILSGTLIAVDGRTASVRMADGSVRRFTAAPSELAALRERVGYSINFIVK